MYASAPELWLALQMGAEVFVKRLYVGTIKTDDTGTASHSWSAVTEEMENVSGSGIISPVYACLTTAGVRAVLVAALNQIITLGYKVYSVTTDGFISDVPKDVLNDLNLYGLTRMFRAGRKALTGSEEMWNLTNTHGQARGVV